MQFMVTGFRNKLAAEVPRWFWCEGEDGSRMEADEDRVEKSNQRAGS